MATATSTGSGNWSAAIWSGGSGSGGAPADGDAVVIAAGHSVLMDTDLSAWTGLIGITITGVSSGTPGMLYFKDGTDGTIKLRTGAYKIQGTNHTVLGRLLVNSNGTWGATGSLAFANKAIIMMAAGNQIDATYLSVNLYCTEPTVKMVRMYGTKYDFTASASTVDTVNDTIDLGTTPPSANTPVMITSAAGVLPGGLSEDFFYYVRGVSGNKCKLSETEDDVNLINITSAGSGACTLFTGVSSGSATVNILDDVTAVTGWVTTAGHDLVSLVDWSINYAEDKQNTSLVTINAGSIVLADAIDSDQRPGARICLWSRNVSIRTTSTSWEAYVQTGGSNQIWNCEMRGSGYGAGYVISNNVTIGGSICNVANATYYGFGANRVTAIVINCSSGISGLNNSEFSGICAGSLFGGSNVVFSGMIFGTINGIGGHRIRCTPASKIVGNCYGVTGENCIVEGMFGGPYDAISGLINDLTFRNAQTPNSSLVAQSRNYASKVHDVVRFENFNRQDIHKMQQAYGDVMRTACDGTGDAPSVDPDGGNGYCIEASNIQSNCKWTPVTLIAQNVEIIRDQRIWLTAAAHTVTYKLQTTYAGITAGNLKLTCQYIGPSGVITETHDDPAIDQRDDDTDWSQVLAVTFTPSADGWATFSIDLMEYEAGNEVYIWPTPTIT